ncbi:MAG: hypothetical protein AB8F78_13410 [Saprospiraceae bacterium]
MRRSKIYIQLLVFVGLLSFGSSLAIGQVRVKARLDSAVMLLGDPNRIVVSIDGIDGTASVDWSVLDTVEALVIIGDPTSAKQGNQMQIALPFSVYDSVGLFLPNFPVYLPNETLYTNDLALLVDFPRRDSTLNPYRSIRTESAALSDYLPWIISILIGLAILGVLLYFFYFRKTAPAPPPPPPIPDPAHVIALRSLEGLRGQTSLIDKDYYSTLDHILREYLENRYEIPALERTSSEVVSLLSNEGIPDNDELRDLLSQVDMVKFAKAELPQERRASSFERVQEFVERTKRIAPPTIDASPENPTADV